MDEQKLHPSLLGPLPQVIDRPDRAMLRDKTYRLILAEKSALRRSADAQDERAAGSRSVAR